MPGDNEALLFPTPPPTFIMDLLDVEKRHRERQGDHFSSYNLPGLHRAWTLEEQDFLLVKKDFFLNCFLGG